MDLITIFSHFTEEILFDLERNQYKEHLFILNLGRKRKHTFTSFVPREIAHYVSFHWVWSREIVWVGDMYNRGGMGSLGHPGKEQPEPWGSVETPPYCSLPPAQPPLPLQAGKRGGWREGRSRRETHRFFRSLEITAIGKRKCYRWRAFPVPCVARGSGLLVMSQEKYFSETHTEGWVAFTYVGLDPWVSKVNLPPSFQEKSPAVPLAGLGLEPLPRVSIPYLHALVQH